uniref:GRIP domain-containing protein n=1 Tax=Heterorhabditis bacteriophora TaxID=37862 RepID=A0A1I7XNM5_HETBA
MLCNDDWGDKDSRESIEASMVFSDSINNQINALSLSLRSSMSGMKEETAVEKETDNINIIIKENKRLKAELDSLRADSSKISIEELFRENQSLLHQLNEANSYVDQVDVEAEQQYTELTSEIDELCTLVEKKDNEITVLKDKIQEQTRTNIKLTDQVEQKNTNNQRQAEVIENIRTELDNEREKVRDLVKEKEKIQLEFNKMREKIETDKGDSLAKNVLLSIEIEDMQRELEKQKEILASTSIAQIVDRWERRVLDLENEVREREVIIHTQQCILNELRRLPPRESSSVTSVSGIFNSGGSSSDSFHMKESGLDQSSRNTLIKYILSDRNNQLANIYAIGRILDLSNQEVDYLERSLSKERDRYL